MMEDALRTLTTYVDLITCFAIAVMILMVAMENHRTGRSRLIIAVMVVFAVAMGLKGIQGWAWQDPATVFDLIRDLSFAALLAVRLWKGPM